MPQTPVVIVPYDHAWPAMFDAEKPLIEELLKPWLKGTIEHIGSTAVASLPAKPIIDIMAGVESLQASRPAIAVVIKLGYCYYPYKPDQLHWFCKPSDEVRTHHLHLVPYGNELWKERIAFRDALRNNPEIANEYAALKQALSEEHRSDREAYTEAKSQFITSVLNRSKNAEPV